MPFALDQGVFVTAEDCRRHRHLPEHKARTALCPTAFLTRVHHPTSKRVFTANLGGAHATRSRRAQFLHLTYRGLRRDPSQRTGDRMILWADLNNGERIKWLRGNELTQEALAEKSELSVWTIRDIEQSRNGATGSIKTLTKIAKALGTDIAVLTGQRSPNAQDSHDERAGFQAIEKLINAPDTFLDVPLDPGADAPTLENIREGISEAWSAYWKCDYGVMGSISPKLIAEAKAAAHAAPAQRQGEGHALLAEAYEIAACMVNVMGDQSLAFAILRQSFAAASKCDDPLLAPVLALTLGWIYLRKGNLDAAREVSIVAAEGINPSFGKGTPPEQFSVWGSLLVRGAVAAARNDQNDTAREYMSMAHAAGQRLGTDRNDYQTMFGPTVTQMQDVGIAVSIGDIGRALNLVEHIERSRDYENVQQAAKSRYLLDVAHAHNIAQQDEMAADYLLKIREQSPNFLRHQRLPREILNSMLERERSGRALKIRRLASALHVDLSLR